jgi:Uma2 family endonuclease
MAPTFVAEILSPDDRSADVSDKVRTYLQSGSLSVLVDDSGRRDARIHDGSRTRSFSEDDPLEHDSLPGFTLNLKALFAP